jgi:hypothetical protein
MKKKKANFHTDPHIAMMKKKLYNLEEENREHRDKYLN